MTGGPLSRIAATRAALSEPRAAGATWGTGAAALAPATGGTGASARTITSAKCRSLCRDIARELGHFRLDARPQSTLPRLRLEDRPLGGRAHEEGIAGKHSLPVVRLRRRPSLEARSDVDVFDRQDSRVDVDRDHIAVLERGQRSPDGGLGRDMADHQAARRA